MKTKLEAINPNTHKTAEKRTEKKHSKAMHLTLGISKMCCSCSGKGKLVPKLK